MIRVVDSDYKSLSLFGRKIKTIVTLLYTNIFNLWIDSMLI